MSYYKKKSYSKNASFGERLAENYDIVLVTVLGVVVLGYLGFPISKQTTVISPAVQK